MAAVRQSSRHAASLPLVIAKEGTDVNCRRAIDLARPDSIHLAAAVRRCGVTPQLVQYYKAMSTNIVSLAQGSFRRGVKPSKRKNAVGDDVGSSSGTGSDEDANKANEDNYSAHNKYLSADDFAFFAEVKQRQAVKKTAVDHATWAKKKAKLEKHGYMYLNKGVHYIVHACNLWDS